MEPVQLNVFVASVNLQEGKDMAGKKAIFDLHLIALQHPSLARLRLVSHNPASFSGGTCEDRQKKLRT